MTWDINEIFLVVKKTKGSDVERYGWTSLVWVGSVLIGLWISTNRTMNDNFEKSQIQAAQN